MSSDVDGRQNSVAAWGIEGPPSSLLLPAKTGARHPEGVAGEGVTPRARGDHLGSGIDDVVQSHCSEAVMLVAANIWMIGRVAASSAARLVSRLVSRLFSREREEMDKAKMQTYHGPQIEESARTSSRLSHISDELATRSYAVKALNKLVACACVVKPLMISVFDSGRLPCLLHLVEPSADPGGSTDNRSLSSTPLAPVPTNSGLTTVSRALTSFSFNRSRSVSNVPTNKWGPYGLQLLFSPPDPLVDVIFVHGLRGGSIKTWCKGDDHRFFWPKSWLPREPELQNARIHSFGYNSDWKDPNETSLDLHDFGRSLFGEMSTSPYLRRDGDVRFTLSSSSRQLIRRKTPILLVGHSMGGLAFILAQQDSRAHNLAKRIQTIFFLASPHRGSDSAKLLSNILKASLYSSSRQYVSDLVKGSPSLQIISEEFGKSADGLSIWSFYETLKTKITATTSLLVVDRDSAVLGFKNETAQPLNADHRTICKFNDPSDPNYQTLRNSLAKAVEHMLGDVLLKKADETRALIGSLEAYLHISHYSEDDLSNIESTTGSCNWILEQPLFREWRDAESDSHEIYWLSGPPGSGKTVLAAQVTMHLQKMGLDVSYYFFKDGHKDQQTICGLLRQIAYQMAAIHPSVRQRLSQMQDNNINFDKDDERAIWRKVFINEILGVPLPNPQFWVIDGLDECRDAGKLFQMLSKLESAYPLSIFISSRRSQGFEKHFTTFKDRLFSHYIEPEDTLPDIRRFVEKSCDELSIDVEYRSQLIETIVEKSDVSFLWTRLAFEELEQAYSDDCMTEVLEEIPGGMVALYTRILESMATNNRRELDLTKTILAWVVCATRKLKASELQAAIKLDLQKNIRSIERSIEGLCGQLIRIEKTGTVQLIHSTARDFLIDQDLESVLAVDRSDTQERLAIVCLTYLCSDEMRPPKSRALTSELKDVQSDFADYAATSWSEHVAGASSENGKLLDLIYQFFTGNVLTWIEYIARRKKNLYHITQTAKKLRNYLDRRAKYASPLGIQFATIDRWTTDLLRIVAKFGRSLLLYPSAIYFIIPPLCPSSSSVYRQFGSSFVSSRALLSITGLESPAWDDCICYIEHRNTRAMSLAGADNMFAIGLKSGNVKLYHKTTCQERATLFHGEPVKVLKFDNASQRLATSGNRKLKMWSVEGELLWSKTHTDPPVTLLFSQEGDILVAGTKASGIVSWRCDDGADTLIDPHGSKNPTKVRQFAKQAILSSSVSPDLRILVVAYRGRSPQAWSLEEDVALGTFEKEAMSICQVLFNPNPNIELVAFTYQDGEVTIFNPWRQEELASVAGEGYTMAATPDGRTLATGDTLGTIKLRDFETLNLLYVIKSADYEVRSLAFSGDGLRLFDIRDAKSKVWEPAALVRKTINDDSSVSESAAGQGTAPTVGNYGETVAITVMLAPPDVDCIFVGKDNGMVYCYDKSTGKIFSRLYSHRRDVLITVICWNSAKSLLTTLDVSYTVQLWQLERDLRGGWKAVAQLEEMRWETPVRDIDITPDGTHLLIRDAIADHFKPILSSEEQGFVLPHAVESERLTSQLLWYKTVNSDFAPLAATASGRIWQYRHASQSGFSLIGSAVQTLDGENQPVRSPIRRMRLDSSNAFLGVELDEDSTYGANGPKLLVYRLEDILPSAAADEREKTATPVLWLKTRDIKSSLGFYEDKVIFLDENLWIRSLDLSSPPETRTEAARYFFIPYEFIGGNNGVEGTVTEAGDVIFPRDGELGVVKNGLKWVF
ncbi:hypothetical protein G7046_g5442 [Stylonectria norvegica]|nr:hypothetical protein G7046_g5442 [Stylonectria norvegica]